MVKELSENSQKHSRFEAQDPNKRLREQRPFPTGKAFLHVSDKVVTTEPLTANILFVKQGCEEKCKR